MHLKLKLFYVFCINKVIIFSITGSVFRINCSFVNNFTRSPGFVEWATARKILKVSFAVLLAFKVKRERGGWGGGREEMGPCAERRRGWEGMPERAREREREPRGLNGVSSYVVQQHNCNEDEPFSTKHLHWKKILISFLLQLKMFFSWCWEFHARY